MFRFRGLGFLVLPMIIFGMFGGGGAAFAALPGIHHSGVPLGGIALGLVAAGGVMYLLGVVLNRRRSPDGSWHWTGRHEFEGIPLEVFGKWTAFAGLVAAPLAMAGFVPVAVVWVAWLGWAAAVTAGLVALSRQRVARRKARRDTAPAAKGPVQAVKGKVIGEESSGSHRSQ